MKYATILVTSDNMKAFLLYSVVLIIVSGCNGDQVNETEAYLSSFIADLWLEGADVVRIIWIDCSKKLIDVKDIEHKENFPKFLRCMKRKTLRALDRSLSPDVVPIADGVNLVRFELIDRFGNAVPENETSTWSERELEEEEWRILAMKRMAKVLRTHVIKFDFGTEKTMEKVEFRGRRRHQLLTMMMFGVVSIGMVFIPMGFQFLAVLGGKALLLAKMALILASIQGLKKPIIYLFVYLITSQPNPLTFKIGLAACTIVMSVFIGNRYFLPPGRRCTALLLTICEDNRLIGVLFQIAASPVNYGFYHSFPPYDHYDKRSRDDWAQSGIMLPSTSSTMHSPWSNQETGGIKVDRIHIAGPEDMKIVKRKLEERIDNPESVKNVDERARLFPIYAGPINSALPIFTSIDAPTPLVDLTTRPGEVQADFSLDLPYNGFRFQSPTSVISA